LALYRLNELAYCTAFRSGAAKHSRPKRSRQIRQQKIWPTIAHHQAENDFLRDRTFANEAAGVRFSLI
jgi:hypothetical protein